MAEADLNHDGTVDADEWEIFEKKQEEEFLKEEMSRQAAMPNQDKMLIKAPAKGDFVIATKSEQELVSSFGWWVPLAIGGGIVACGFGVWLAITSNWSPLFIVGLLGAGFVLSFFTRFRAYMS